MKNEINPYRKMLDLCVDNYDGHEKLRTPFIQGDIAIASDGHIIASINISHLDKIDFQGHADAPDALSLLSGTNFHECNIVFDVEKLRESVHRCDELMKSKYEIKPVGCVDCHGKGEVEFTFDTFKGKTHKVIGECPTCDGEGSYIIVKERKTGDVVWSDVFEIIQWSDTFFQCFYIDKLVAIADLLNEKTISLISRKSNKSIHFFNIGKALVGLMPYHPNTIDLANHLHIVVQLKSNCDEA